jgi:outer membrane lipoprotein-sorting protein
MLPSPPARLAPWSPDKLEPVARLYIAGFSRMQWSFAAILVLFLSAIPIPAQQPDDATIVRDIDAAVKTRLDHIAGYTVHEHYAVYRDNDEIHPVAEMLVKTVYRQETGKSYTILTESGSAIIRSQVIGRLLDNEKTINQPGNRELSWLTSANYEMKVKPGGTQLLDGRSCYLISLTPRRKTPYLVDGTLWVDSRDFQIAKIEGVGSKSPSILTGTVQMMRQYTEIDGWAMAAHARAVSSSFLFGQTIVKIDYQDYAIELRPVR